VTSDHALPIREGEVIAGKYRVDRVLGSGGMGIVVAANHLQLQHAVALKFLQPDALGSKDALNRFLREGQVLARLKSPHVARVMDVGTLEHGEPYLVMEYLQGSDLGTVLRERGRLPIAEAVSYVLQACEAVAEAHANGIVHRDLKPSNLFLTQGADGLPLVKVLDFGIAKAPHVAAEREALVTTTGSLMGSPLYMSPEQIRSPKRVNTRTDIWSLGVILYELLSGITPFEGETPSAALAAIIADAPTPLRTIRREVPVELEAAVARCLKKEADSRTGSILELAQSLEEFVTAESRGSVLRIARLLGVALPRASLPPRAGSDANTDEAKSATVPSWENGARQSQKIRRRAVVSVGAAMFGVLALFAWRRSTVADIPNGPRPASIGGIAAGESHPAPSEEAVKPAPVVPPPAVAPSASVATNPVSSSAPAPSARPEQGKPKAPRPATPAAHKRRGSEEIDDGTADRK
jgi:serine/threonine-protein kinase